MENSPETEDESPSAPRIAVAGDNVWRVDPAGRVGVCIDAETYFGALEEAALRAERSILIAGWDIHSKLRLRRGEGESSEPLGSFLDGLVRRKPHLHIHILGWDFALIYSLERESLPLLRFGIRTHRRIHFHLDGDHPMGSSHHQKIVVVDDAIAFVGGIDLTAYRWDTREHRPHDPRRVTPSGDVYGPFHDVQMAVDGPAAVAVAELLRERWKRATGRELPAVGATGDRWPDSLSVIARDVPIGIARTEPEWSGREGVREVERSLVDMIESAQDAIYIENQYFTAPVLVEALVARLGGEDGPDVVLTVPRQCSGWLEEATMGLLRRRAVARLREADTHGRLRVVYPEVGADPPVAVNVHAKVMIVDDRCVRVGSANLNNRSMGLDTECDLLMEASCTDHAKAIANLRDEFLAEHLGVEPSEVRQARADHGSLVAALDALRAARDGPRTLVDVPDESGDVVDTLVPDTSMLDPERPIDPRVWIERLGPEEETPATWAPALRILGIALPLVALALLWRYGPLQGWLDPDSIEATFAPYRDHVLAGPAALLAFLVGGVTMFPVTLLILASALLFGPIWGFAYSAVGGLLSAAAGYWLGSVMWRDAVRRLAGKRLNRLSRRLAESGVVAVAVVRVVPVAPFTIVNLVAGSSHVTLRDFLLGTILGMGPGIAAMTLLADRLLEAVRNPDPVNVGVLAAVAAGWLAAGVWAQQRFGASGRERRTGE